MMVIKMYISILVQPVNGNSFQHQFKNILFPLRQWLYCLCCYLTSKFQSDYISQASNCIAAISRQEQVTFQWDDDDDYVCFLLNQHA